MSIATLQDIITKTRKLSSSANSLQITDSDIIDYINSFYLYDFPAEFRSLDLKDMYTFNTIRGVDTYPFDRDHWINIQPPCYIAKREVRLFTDPLQFYYFNFNSSSHWQREQILTGTLTGTITNITQANPAVVTSANHGLSTGNIILITGVVGMTEINGLSSAVTVIDANSFSLNTIDSTAFTAYTSGGTWTSNVFTGTLQGAPLIRSVNNNPMAQTLTSPTQPQAPGTFPANFTNIPNINRMQNFLITGNISNGSTLNVTDDGAGGLIGDVGAGNNSIDYQTGTVNIAFSEAIPAGQTVTVLYNPVVMNVPLGILFWQDSIIVRPVPDKGYTVELVGYRTPSQALLGTTTTTNMTGRPELLEWWETLAVGAAKKIYEDRLDMDGVAMMDKMLQERYQQNYTRTYANMSKKRIGTIYADQLEFTYGVGPFGIGNFN